MPKLNKFILISLFLLLFFPVFVQAVCPPSWTCDYPQWDPAHAGNQLQWEAVEPENPDAPITKIYYHIYRIKGYQIITLPAACGTDTGWIWSETDKVVTDPQNGLIMEDADDWDDVVYLGFTDGTEIFDGIGYDYAMTYGYAIRVWDCSVGEYSGMSCTARSRFIYDKERGDMLGKQVGFGQKWNFSYKLQADAYITMKFYRAFTFPRIGKYDIDYYDDLCFRLRLSSTNIQNMADIPQEIRDDAKKPAEEGKRQGEHAFLCKTLLQNVPRSCSMAAGDVENEEEWDCRNDDAKMVKNDCYWVMIEAFHRGHGEENSAKSTISDVPDGDQPRLDVWWCTVPVDLLRIINLEATGISATVGEATISYDLTGDAKVKIKVCLPGTRFRVDLDTSSVTYGEAMPIDPETGEDVFDPETGECWSYLDKTKTTSQGKYGRLVWEYVHYMDYGERKFNKWNGSDIEGNAYPQLSKDGVLGIHFTDEDVDAGRAAAPDGKGTYPLVMSAVLVDEQHNIILDEEGKPICATGERGNDQPILALVTYDKTPEAEPVDTTKPVVSFDTPAPGAQVTSLPQVIVKFSDPGGNLVLADCSVVLVGPIPEGEGNVPGTIERTPPGTITFSPEYIPAKTGVYSYTVKAVGKDTVGNMTSSDCSFTLSITEETTVRSWDVTVGSKLPDTDKPGLVKAGEILFCYNPPKTADVTITVYDILGNLVWKKDDLKGQVPLTTGRYEEKWTCVNQQGDPVASGVYIYKIEAKTDSETYPAEPRKIIVIQ